MDEKFGKKINGCAFGRENRILIENITKAWERFIDNDFQEMKRSITNLDTKIGVGLQNLDDRFKTRLPLGVSIIIWVFSGIIVGAVVKILCG